MKDFLSSFDCDIEDVINLCATSQIDFTEDTECYVIDVISDIDIIFAKLPREVTINFKTKHNINAVIEFKTEKFPNIAEENLKIKANAGINSFSFLIPELKSKLKEIDFSIYKKCNPNLITEITILDFYIK